MLCPILPEANLHDYVFIPHLITATTFIHIFSVTFFGSHFKFINISNHHVDLLAVKNSDASEVIINKLLILCINFKDILLQKRLSGYHPTCPDYSVENVTPYLVLSHSQPSQITIFLPSLLFSSAADIGQLKIFSP